ncbi:type I-G CRISPR-associated RAMP protein Csb1/Cas7g [Gimesia panareensis]|uniref:type I-G CRISPR-associated RAMP protein Csb1/Cas7g n=1 Tax=Gimesia panareensis TaxID=2527978 RepID=UPI00118BFA76|nr:type I-U CRISPR-associated RAMP protein Csb1/Cas7u [Gimesia panareensis]QDU47880.1 CRISPR-associated protein (Cas_GSU0053) [Gimesia panareensis]
MATLTLKNIQDAVRDGAAARCRATLQPAGGEGTKVFPPTYADAVYAMEKRRLPDFPEPVDCVLLDSVQSQANRMEEALQQAIDDGTFKKAGISIPLIEVDFAPFWDPEKKNNDLTDKMRLLEPVGNVSSLQAPHRIADAILRDSVVDEEGNDKGKPFRAKKESDESSYGQKLRRVSNVNATALFELCPTALLFGMWDSTGPKGGLGAKFERVMVSEIAGINVAVGTKTSSRIDPLSIQRNAGPLYRRPNGSMTVNPGEAMDKIDKSDKPTGKKVLYKKNKEGEDVFYKPGDATYPAQGRPSEANHGNFPPSLSDRDPKTGDYLAGGVTISRADQTTVISFAALRRLRFPFDNQQSAERNLAAQTVLATLGFCAATLAAESGLDLRSRCLLWPTETLGWELLVKPGKPDDKREMTSKTAITLLKEALDAAKKQELSWREEPLKLRPSDDLVKLVVKSQQLTIQSGGEE